ncbi:MAG: hypothetical protein HC866_09540 [Leptolyngbyaceae cyanobacterium RU_5_1]|nr:hypothetical protein [Leptolyngbyaceae cyanobacterium RU_5_1]
MSPSNSSPTSLNRPQGIYKWLTPLMLASAVLFSSHATTQAASLNFSYAPGTSLNQIIGFEMAGGIWSRHLADPVTVNLYVQTTNDLPSGVIGGALPGILPNQRYESWRNKLATDRTSAEDQLAYKNQQNDADKFTALIDGYKIDNNYYLNMSRANAKAVGMLDLNHNGLDGAILMNTLAGQPVNWNYDFSGQVPINTLDFLSVALHETAHTLGFFSGVDQPGWLIQKTNYDADHQSDFYATLVGKLNNATPLDMFRFSSQSVQQAGSGDSWIDLSVGGNPYFSTDGGKTVLGQFTTGVDTTLGGDGNQASHWKQQGNPLGIMDPTLVAGQRRSLSALDLRAMDAIGWDLQQLGIDLTVLQQQAKEQLAQRLGVTVAWLDSNPEAAAALLTSDRTQDVEAMIEQSQIYNWRSGRGGGWWQGGLWQTSPVIVNSPSQVAAVPGPSLLPALLVGKGLLALRSLYKRRSKKHVRF